MRGSIVKRTNSKGQPLYYAVIDAPSIDGKRKQAWHGDPDTGHAFERESAAEAHLAELLVSRNAGTYVNKSEITVKEWGERWLRRKKPQLKPSTWSSYERNLRNHVFEHIGKIPMQDVTPELLEELLAKLATDGHQFSGKALSPRTLTYIRGLLKAMMQAAVRKHILATNPAIDLEFELPDEDANPHRGREDQEIQYWTAPELSQFLGHIDGTEYGPIITALALTGARRGELVALTWHNVDLDNRQLILRETAGRVSGQGVITGTTKGGRGRSVAMDDDLKQVIEDQARRQQRHQELLGEGYQDNLYVFCRPDGTQYNPDRVSKVFDREVKKAKIRRIRLHDLRHTWATLALSAGINPKVVQERLGHANVQITLAMYSHVMPGLQDEAAAQVSALIRAAKDPRVAPLRMVR